MGTGAAEVLDLCGLGRVLTLFCDDVYLARQQLRLATEEQDTVPTLVALEWEHAPSLAHELYEIRDALAQAAASLWPNWYITAEERFERSRTADLDDAVVAEALGVASSTSTSWLRQVWQRCREGLSPIVEHMASADQVRQLSHALDPSRLVFALSVASEAASPARIRGLAGAATWLALESQAKVLLLVPAAWQGKTELDHVAYGAVTFQSSDQPLPRPQSEPVAALPAQPRSAAQPKPIGAPLPPRDASPHVLIGPVVGKPHPGSEVEQLVYTRIMADAKLRGLFEYNQRLTAFGHARYTVDLVWRSGRLVVELDGPEHHSHVMYVKDRDRDYRLFMSGYTTLRITNDEVCVNVERVLEKIRSTVARLQSLQDSQRNQNS